MLRLATCGSAQNMRLENRIGRIAPGMAADMILVAADPTADLRALRRLDHVIKDGVIFEPPALFQLAGITIR